MCLRSVRRVIILDLRCFGAALEDLLDLSTLAGPIVLVFGGVLSASERTVMSNSAGAGPSKAVTADDGGYAMGMLTLDEYGAVWQDADGTTWPPKKKKKHQEIVFVEAGWVRSHTRRRSSAFPCVRPCRVSYSERAVLTLSFLRPQAQSHK